MTIEKIRKYFRNKVKSEPTYTKGECYELSGLRMEKQIEFARQKGPGIYPFFYMKCKKSIIKNGNSAPIESELLSEKISVTES
jgi:hypothetical protein